MIAKISSGVGFEALGSFGGAYMIEAVANRLQGRDV